MAMVCVPLLLALRVEHRIADPLPEPRVYYSDWVSDMRPLSDWSVVAGSQELIIDWLKRIFAREGIPEDLVWLAAVESGFDPRARSRQGAVGLFQLMPVTAERYGMRVRNPDERYDPMRNAEVAARYLGDLYARFGDWRLVAAAFNTGENRLARLMRLRGSTYEAVAPWLPAETRSYVPRVAALIAYHEGTGLEKVRPPYQRRGGMLVRSDRIDP